ncbi:four-carbon acid sugar kinase family protein [Nodosilinea sp. PGN35]|uniref:four-carbon acid sugar kinase family protein n=1 Tax=Nodosilinea sp. PGN35 TaxID=3020489 RepID=UPI0023B2B593|nr:four-carbon acid sugar kinase family protein [Nodosilinea sp. TSF1-S3]MDF0365862.1 four-carbon acid sugar kinase family protein [Nodosilinea sp. TSF1-S3]
MAQPKIIVLDDDPTGSQTVHSCLLLMQWDVDTLRQGLQDASPIFFVLTNTRALTAAAAERVTREVCQNLKQAIALVGIQDFLVVSRSDSTLRGHYPVETDAIADVLGPFDAHFLVPAFFEGGRITRDSTHYLMVDGTPTPVHETEFAQDSVFGYSTSYLPAYVAEKTAGQIQADAVERFTLADIRAGSLDRLMALEHNVCCAVDSETQADLDQFAQDLLAAAAQGKKFLFRSAASILTALAALPPQPIDADHMGTYVRDGRPGAIVVGSHVKKTTQQLERLLQEPGVTGIEVDVAQLRDAKSVEPAAFQQQEPTREHPSRNRGSEAHALLLANTLNQVTQAHSRGQVPVVYTSRDELSFDSVQARLDFGIEVSSLLMDVIQGLPADIGFLISKGGITSNDTLSTGLALRTARLLGQILPGVSAVRTPADHPQFPNLPVVLFPGNVGDGDALALAYRRLMGR